MNLAPVPIDDFSLWLASFGRPEILRELALLSLCGLLAWALVALLRRVFSPDTSYSIWFGSSVIDGVLFPSTLLALGFTARTFWAASHPIHIFAVAIPVLVALVVIRVGVKVLQVAFRDAAWLRPIERTISWGA